VSAYRRGGVSLAKRIAINVLSFIVTASLLVVLVDCSRQNARSDRRRYRPAK
jgi:hypothetical protein